MRPSICSPSFLILAFGVMIFFWQSVSGDLFADGVSGWLIALGRLCGLAAALLIITQVLIITRVSWLERTCGYDRLSRVHRWNAAVILVLVFSHVLSLVYGYAIQRDVPIAYQYWDFFESWDGVNLASLGVLALSLIALISSRLLRSYFSYSPWYWLHLFVFPSVVLVTLHQFETGPTANSNVLFWRFWFLLFLLTVLHVVYARIVRPACRNRRHKFEVARFETECPGVTSVIITGREMDAFSFSAGQFVLVRFLQAGFYFEEHPFSLSLAPGQGVIRLTIKAIGDFTMKIPTLKPGTQLLLDGPFGVLTKALSHSQMVTLYAGGIGITPLRALAEDMLMAGITVTLLYSNRDQSGIALRTELEELSKKRGLILHYILSQDPSWSGEHGRLNAAMIKRLVPDFLDADHYLCGPPAMMAEIEKLLVGLGVARRKIHSERFAL